MRGNNNSGGSGGSGGSGNAGRAAPEDNSGSGTVESQYADVLTANSSVGNWSSISQGIPMGGATGNPFEFSLNNINPITHTQNWIMAVKNLFKKK